VRPGRSRDTGGSVADVLTRPAKWAGPLGCRSTSLDHLSLEDVLEPAPSVMLVQELSGNATRDPLTTLLWRRLQSEEQDASLAPRVAGLADGELADGRGASVRP